MKGTGGRRLVSVELLIETDEAGGGLRYLPRVALLYYPHSFCGGEQPKGPPRISEGWVQLKVLGVATRSATAADLGGLRCPHGSTAGTCPDLEHRVSEVPDQTQDLADRVLELEAQLHAVAQDEAETAAKVAKLLEQSGGRQPGHFPDGRIALDTTGYDPNNPRPDPALEKRGDSARLPNGIGRCGHAGAKVKRGGGRNPQRGTCACGEPVRFDGRRWRRVPLQ